MKKSKRPMDASERSGYWKGSDKRNLPPLYESVNGKETENKSILCHRINRSLLPFKAYYFFFYAAVGALFPFIALYYRHLWLSSAQAGLLVGLRPIVQSLFLPLWAIVADKCHVKKLVLLVGLLGWLLTHTSILLVPSGEKPASCNDNATIQEQISNLSLDKNHAPFRKIITDKSNARLERRAVIDRSVWQLNSTLKQNPKFRSRLNLSKKSPDRPTFQNASRVAVSEKSPHFTKSRETNSFRASKEVYPKINSEDRRFEESIWTISNRNSMKTWHTFTILICIIVLGNIFSAPAQTLANTATLQGLAADTHKYGLQRYFGSVGWGFAAFVVGMLVSINHDSSLACKGMDDVNYTPCFYAFGILMAFAFVVALFFKFDQEGKVANEQVGVYRSLRQGLDCLTCFVLFTAFIAGFNMGFIQTFLFWHLQTLGGTQVLFSLITALNALGELIGFLLSVKLIERFGHLKVISLGMTAYAIRMFVYGLVKNPWLVLIVEVLKAFTASAIWASLLSFIGISKDSAATFQSILHMLYWGIGYGGGGILGGILMQYISSNTIFLGLGFVSVLDMLAILLIVNLNCCPKRKQDIYMPLDSEEEDEEEYSESER